MTPKVYIPEMTFGESHYVRGNLKWRADTLYKFAEQEGLVEFDYPLVAFNTSNNDAFNLENLSDFIFQMKRVLNCDYSIPIILDDYGQVADGYHRICKAILYGRESIKAIRLNRMPEADCVINDHE